MLKKPQFLNILYDIKDGIGWVEKIWLFDNSSMPPFTLIITCHSLSTLVVYLITLTSNLSSSKSFWILSFMHIYLFMWLLRKNDADNMFWLFETMMQDWRTQHL